MKLNFLSQIPTQANYVFRESFPVLIPKNDPFSANAHVIRL